MTAISSAAAQTARLSQKEVETSPIPAFSTVLKVLGLIPFIGTVPAVIGDYLHKGPISQETDPKRAIELIESKNHFKYIHVTRIALEVLAVVGLAAAGVLSGGLVLGVAITFLAVCAGVHAYRAHHNRNVIDDIKNERVSLGEQVL